MAHKKQEEAEQPAVTSEAFRKNVAAVCEMARREGGVIVTDAEGRARFLVSTPADKWPATAKKA